MDSEYDEARLSSLSPSLQHSMDPTSLARGKILILDVLLAGGLTYVRALAQPAQRLVATSSHDHQCDVAGDSHTAG